MLLLLVCIGGIFLGLYFSVWVLLPVSLVGTVIFASTNLAFNFSLFANAGDLLLLLLSGQAGYFLGLTGRDAYGHLLARFQAVPSNRI